MLSMQSFDNTELYTAFGGGFSATCDAYVSGAEGKEIYFASLIGAQTSVKAIIASMLKGHGGGLTLMKGTEPEDFDGGYLDFIVPFETVGTWTFKLKQLAMGRGYHAVVYTKWAQRGYESEKFLVMARSLEEAPTLHYRFLDQKCPLPLHPDWTNWLWTRGQDASEITELQGTGLRGFYCEPDFKKLETSISRAVRDGIIGA